MNTFGIRTGSAFGVVGIRGRHWDVALPDVHLVCLACRRPAHATRWLVLQPERVAAMRACPHAWSETRREAGRLPFAECTQCALRVLDPNGETLR